MTDKLPDQQQFKKNLKSYKRTRNCYDPQSTRPYRLSRFRLETFLACPRCFYLDRKLGVTAPGMPPFTLNSAVDELLKREFDQYRRECRPHPLMKKYGIDALPMQHPKLDEWRENFKGVQYHDIDTNMIIFGAVDDLWVDQNNTVYVVDYKATSTSKEVTIDTESRSAYKRQMEIYQWLLRKNGLDVSNLSYFVYCNADKRLPSFDASLKFNMEIIPYKGDDRWVSDVIQVAYKCLQDNKIPEYTPTCEFCLYRKNSYQLEEDVASEDGQFELFG